MHSPTPWRVVHGPARGLVILDAGGEAVAATLDPARQRSEADAAYIVEAVNERDRLRDIMRRLVAILDTITLEDHEIALLDEAREALEEEVPNG